MSKDVTRPAVHEAEKTKTDHRFLDEAGDTTFFGKGKELIVGQEGVSLAFTIGMVMINKPLADVRAEVIALQKTVEKDEYLNVIPSVRKRMERGGFFFHASDDTPEVRQVLFHYLKTLDCSLEAVVARKIPEVFARKHNHQETEFYADVLSHLIKNKLGMGGKLVLNISGRANSTSNRNLQAALEKATGRAVKKRDADDLTTQVVFNVQNHRTEPLLNVADYLCWSVQRVFERGETRHYDYLGDRIRLVVDLYDQEGYEGSRNYYRGKRRLTAENRLGPPSS
jgi:hypothetical protein